MFLISKGEWSEILPYDPDIAVAELIDQEHIGW